MKQLLVCKFSGIRMGKINNYKKSFISTKQEKNTAQFFDDVISE